MVSCTVVCQKDIFLPWTLKHKYRLKSSLRASFKTFELRSGKGNGTLCQMRWASELRNLDGQVSEKTACCSRVQEGVMQVTFQRDGCTMCRILDPMDGIQNPEMSGAVVVSLALSLRHWQMSLSELKRSHKQVTKPLTGLGRQRVSQNSVHFLPTILRRGKGKN